MIRQQDMGRNAAGVRHELEDCDACPGCGHIKISAQRVFKVQTAVLDHPQRGHGGCHDLGQGGHIIAGVQCRGHRLWHKAGVSVHGSCQEPAAHTDSGCRGGGHTVCHGLFQQGERISKIVHLFFLFIHFIFECISAVLFFSHADNSCLY